VINFIIHTFFKFKSCNIIWHNIWFYKVLYSKSLWLIYLYFEKILSHTTTTPYLRGKYKLYCFIKQYLLKVYCSLLWSRKWQTQNSCHLCSLRTLHIVLLFKDIVLNTTKWCISNVQSISKNKKSYEQFKSIVELYR